MIYLQYNQYSMKNFHLLFICLMALAIRTNAQCNGRYLDSIFQSVTMTTEVFGSSVKYNTAAQTLNMDIYSPTGDVVKNRPCVVFCFGGSFIAGDRKSAELVLMSNYFAKKGYVCVSIDYRLDNGLNLLADETMLKALVRASQDGKAAVRYLHKNADALGIDSNQIFMGGTSAGGLLSINMAYLDANDKLIPDWTKWINDIGGLEGNSGTPGYSSKVKGVFSFAGAIGDTAFISQNDLPIYMCHAAGDQTVPIGFGKPLSGAAPVNVYGSDMMNQSMKSKNCYTRYDRYTSASHPPFVSDLSILDSTMRSMKWFLYDNINCNPNKFNEITPIQSQDLTLYPNPASEHIALSEYNNIKSISICSIEGKEMKVNASWKVNGVVELLNYAKGMYIMKIKLDNHIKTIKFAVQ
jgi:para-nitrobenzyl esterase